MDQVITLDELLTVDSWFNGEMQVFTLDIPDDLPEEFNLYIDFYVAGSIRTLQLYGYTVYRKETQKGVAWIAMTPDVAQRHVDIHV